MKIIKFKQFLEEKRSNPELNPKISAYEYLKHYSDKDDYYISFTKIDKLGINPHSEWITPLGIYCYPLKETFKEYEVEKNKSLKEYPYGHYNPYVWLIKSKIENKILNLDSYTKDEYEKDLIKLYDIKGKDKFDTINDFYDYIQNINKRNSNKIHQSFIIKNVSYIANDFIAPTEKRESNFSIKFSSLFLKLGYDGIVDLGKGVIQRNELFQAVFFNIKSIEIIDKFLNKDYKGDVNG